MRFLVTGAGGFIGSHLAHLLVSEGHTVWATVMPGKPASRLSDIQDAISIVAVDLRDQAAVRALVSAARPDCAFHLAWYAIPGQYWGAAENLDCVGMSLSFAKALSEVGCRRLVGVGTCAEYDWDFGFLSEDTTPLRPRTLYGVCKNATRQVLQTFCELVSMTFAWARIFYLYGPGEAETRLVPSVILSLLKEQRTKCTGAEKIRDYLYVEDVVSALLAVGMNNVSGPVNIGSGQPLKIRSIVEALSKIFGHGDFSTHEFFPAESSEPPLLVADVRKLRSLTGWTPRWDLEEGLAQSAAWWQRHEKQKKYE